MKLSSIGDGDVWVVYDLECTAWPGSAESGWSKPNEFREIIQIGAVKVDVNANLAEISSCVINVKPKLNPILSDYITDLTGITQKVIEDSGLSFPEAAGKFMEFIGTETDLVCCNGCDTSVLEENCCLNNMENSFLNYKFVDLMPFFEAELGGIDVYPESGKLPELFGLSRKHGRHRGLDDSRNILDVLRYLNHAS